jgi:tetratricopeptide (TPR) repeat protein
MPTQEELQKLPRWCQVNLLTLRRTFHNDTQSASDELMKEREGWARTIGEDVFSYMHHYCMGLNVMNRYFDKEAELATAPEDKKELEKKRLAGGLEEFNFVKDYLRQAHNVFYPELLLNEAVIYRELDDVQKAIGSLAEALKVKPDYVAAYLELSRTMKTAGDATEAKKVLDLGLKMTSGSEAIKRALEAYRSRDDAVTSPQ